MALIYNMSKLNEGSNIVEWVLIINQWSGGSLFSVIVVAFSLITFAIQQKVGIDFEDAAITTFFSWFLISGLLWLIQFDSYRAIPTALPVLYGLFMGLAVFFKLVRGWMQ